MGFLCFLQILMYLLLCSKLSATNVTLSSLDALLQDYSFRAFLNPRTGIIYEATVPSNLTGIKLAAIRLRSGSLKKRGLTSFKEFSFPSGVNVKPYVTRLVLVYQNLANLSSLYYPLSSSYDYVAPVLGLLAYDAKNLSAVNSPELDLEATKDPIRINFSDLVRNVSEGSIPKCVRFDSQGRVSVGESVKSGNICETKHQGHFSVVVASAPSPAPPPEEKLSDSDSNSKIWIIVGSVVGGLILLGILTCLVLRCRSFKKEERIKEMERAGETEEALRMTHVGETRAPTATTTRTQPMLETDYSA